MKCYVFQPFYPFYPGVGQQSMNVRQRFPNPVNQGMIYPQMIYAMNQSQFGGQQPLVMNTSMVGLKKAFLHESC